MTNLLPESTWKVYRVGKGVAVDCSFAMATEHIALAVYNRKFTIWEGDGAILTSNIFKYSQTQMWVTGSPGVYTPITQFTFEFRS